MLKIFLFLGVMGVLRIVSASMGLGAAMNSFAFLVLLAAAGILAFLFKRPRRCDRR
jgi:hypothetical protein